MKIQIQPNHICVQCNEYCRMRATRGKGLQANRKLASAVTGKVKL